MWNFFIHCQPNGLKVENNKNNEKASKQMNFGLDYESLLQPTSALKRMSSNTDGVVLNKQAAEQFFNLKKVFEQFAVSEKHKNK